jgi:hypothetical protein
MRALKSETLSLKLVCICNKNLKYNFLFIFSILGPIRTLVFVRRLWRFIGAGN